MSQEIASVEFHDAQISKIVLLPDGNAEVHFDHVSVFCARSALQYDVMSHSAVLRIGGANAIKLNGSWTTEDRRLSHVEVDGRHIRSVSAPADVATITGSKVALIFGTGCTLDFLFERLSLELFDGEFLETWDGPLVL